MNQKEITIGGKQVKMIYCAATENGFEDISEKSIQVFVPTFDKDKDGKVYVKEPAKAHIGDFVMLAFAGIVAAYVKDNEEVPVSSDEILYNTTPQERNDLITAIVELRNEWYSLPKVVADEVTAENANAEGEEQPKNA